MFGTLESRIDPSAEKPRAMAPTLDGAVERVAWGGDDEGLEEARVQTRRRRLRHVVVVFFMVIAAVTIAWGLGGAGHPSPRPRTGTSSSDSGGTTGSSNGTAPIVLDGQSVNTVVPVGAKTLWVFTVNEEAISGGGQGIELTTNGGLSWTDATPRGLNVDGGDHWIGNFGALSATDAFIVFGHIDSGPQIIEMTQDAGRTWSKVGTLPTPPGGCELQFVNVHDGTCTVLGGALGSMTVSVFRTANGGASWRKVYANTPNTTSATKGAIPFACDKRIDFINARTGFALFFCNAGSGADVEESLNGGSYWTERPVVQPSAVPEGGGGFSGPPVFDGLNGAVPYSVGTLSEVYVTNNGGLTFHPVYPPDRRKRWVEDIASPTIWRLTYGKEILATNDAGKSWFTVTSDTVLQTNDYGSLTAPGGIVQFTTPNDGWLTENEAAVHSLLLRTTDGGRRWRTVFVPGTKRL
ncbi:MAG: hypothetical protein ABSA07_01130 [Acidimicrobiales bacterium]